MTLITQSRKVWQGGLLLDSSQRKEVIYALVFFRKLMEAAITSTYAVQHGIWCVPFIDFSSRKCPRDPNVNNSFSTPVTLRFLVWLDSCSIPSDSTIQPLYLDHPVISWGWGNPGPLNTSPPGLVGETLKSIPLNDCHYTVPSVSIGPVSCRENLLPSPWKWLLKEDFNGRDV